MCGGVRQGVGDVLAEGAGGRRAACFAAHIGVGGEPADGACHGVFRVRVGEAGFVSGFGEQGGFGGVHGGHGFLGSSAGAAEFVPDDGDDLSRMIGGRFGLRSWDGHEPGGGGAGVGFDDLGESGGAAGGAVVAGQGGSIVSGVRGGLPADAPYFGVYHGLDGVLPLAVDGFRAVGVGERLVEAAVGGDCAGVDAPEGGQGLEGGGA